MKPHLDQFYAKDEENQHGAPTIMSMGIRRNSYVTLSWRADEEKAKEKSMFIHLSIICEGIFWLVHQSWSCIVIASLLLHTLAGWWVVRTICFLLIQESLICPTGANAHRTVSRIPISLGPRFAPQYSTSLPSASQWNRRWLSNHDLSAMEPWDNWGLGITEAWTQVTRTRVLTHHKPPAAHPAVFISFGVSLAELDNSWL